MRVSGSAQLHAPRDQVWTALNDPAVLVRTIPGCQRLEAIGDDAYRMTVTAGVASIKGVYTGEVRLSEQQPPDKFLLKAAGAGSPGTVSADVWVTLTESGSNGEGSRDSAATTTLTYDADAIVGGMIGGVGQRMLTGVAKKTAGEFFAAVDEVLAGVSASERRPALSPETAAEVAAEQPTVIDAAPVTSAPVTPDAPQVPQVYEAPGAAQALAAANSAAGFVQGALVGAGAALLGAIIGWWLASRRYRR